ncbi:CDP-alcohol phosphatidyltransferase family protein [Pseudarthrobacter chlorophenolicus]|uniref:CDP-alcohol phosphatidyltransferase family protein n=1 Tax=Pseudarthrobacter chlorophenolicus TaxID=85085 RepID=UPI001F1E46BB|nr:CDP-alcohol phosphatidyltransferase family protein [Pseudarthrobacter chlorophenolicus]
METITTWRPTPADRITLVRATLAAVCAVLAIPPLFTGDVPGQVPGLLLVVLGSTALLLDAVDGPVARRTGTASDAGARFDSATDAFLVLVLSIATVTVVGPWTLAIGAMYYLVAAAGIVRPHLREPLPRSTARKVIGAVQPLALLLALVIAQVPGMPPALAAAAPAVALPLLLFSFGRDVVVLERRHRASTEAAPRPGAGHPVRPVR